MYGCQTWLSSKMSRYLHEQCQTWICWKHSHSILTVYSIMPESEVADIHNKISVITVWPLKWRNDRPLKWAIVCSEHCRPTNPDWQRHWFWVHRSTQLPWLLQYVEWQVMCSTQPGLGKDVALSPDVTVGDMSEVPRLTRTSFMVTFCDRNIYHQADRAKHQTMLENTAE